MERFPGSIQSKKIVNFSPLINRLGISLKKFGFKKNGKTWVFRKPDLITVLEVEKMSRVEISTLRIGFWFPTLEPFRDGLLASQCHIVADWEALVPEAKTLAKQFIHIERNPEYAQSLEERLMAIDQVADAAIQALVERYSSIELLRRRYLDSDLRSAGIMGVALAQLGA